MIQRDGTGKFELLGESVQFASISFCKALVEMHSDGLLTFARVKPNPDGEPAAGDVLVDNVPDLRLEHFHLPG